LTDDSASSVSLPEVPLLAVLPGTGGLTRVTDKRRVRRDRADVFCATVEGVRGKRAADWGLVDEVVPNAKFDAVVQERAAEFAASSGPRDAVGLALPPLDRRFGEDGAVTYSHVEVSVDRPGRVATLTLRGPEDAAPPDALDATSWMICAARELEDAVLHLRFNETEIGLWVFKTQGDPSAVLAHEAALLAAQDDWLAQEVLLLWKRVLKRIDVTSRSLVALVEHGSCFAGPLAELLFAVDRSYMMEDAFDGDNRPLASVTLSDGNFGTYPMGNGLTRLQTRFLGAPEAVDAARDHVRAPLLADAADDLGLVTMILDDIDWDDEIRIFLEERASFSPDAMTGLEANLRFAGPETMETRIFGRLTAWQNWIFNRPNAVGPDGALRSYGTGVRGKYDMERV